jgi:hypothetical protein
LKDKPVKDRMNLVNNITNYRYSDIILPSPIYVFEGIAWKNIVLLFKLNGFELNGGTISRRHRLNINQYRLSLFLGYSDLLSSRDAFYDSYKDQVFSLRAIIKRSVDYFLLLNITEIYL